MSSTSPGLPSEPLVVVVVEDETLIRMMAVDSLAEEGFVVIEAGSADEALAVLKSKAGEIHVVFSDVHMPGAIDGLDLARHVPPIGRGSVSS